MRFLWGALITGLYLHLLTTNTGYAFLLFQDESSVQALIDACINEDDKLYLCVSSPTIKDKPVSNNETQLALRRATLLSMTGPASYICMSPRDVVTGLFSSPTMTRSCFVTTLFSMIRYKFDRGGYLMLTSCWTPRCPSTRAKQFSSGVCHALSKPVRLFESCFARLAATIVIHLAVSCTTHLPEIVTESSRLASQVTRFEELSRVLIWLKPSSLMAPLLNKTLRDLGG